MHGISMTAGKFALLEDRGVVAVTGEDAGAFLDNLITNDLELLDKQGAIFAGLLSPQGKILFDFLVVKHGAGYLIDVPREQTEALIKRLSMYKLRSKVALADGSADYRAFAFWGVGGPDALPAGSIVFDDPRSAALGKRGLLAAGIDWTAAGPGWDGAEAFHTHRIAAGVPEIGKDYLPGEAFAHEALFDQINGVSFTKGCYVGQEIVARMEHRGTARKRFVRVTGEAALPPRGTPVLADDVPIGEMGSSAGSAGLALLRLDRLMEFAEKCVRPSAGGVALTANLNDVTKLSKKLAFAQKS